MSERVSHCFAPVFDSESSVLILGTMPSPESRRQGFYYSHPRNRFWQIMAELFGAEMPETPEERRAFALAHGFALWDVLSACDIDGASDSSITRPEVNDLGLILDSAPIKAVFTTGTKAAQLYARYCLPQSLPQNIPLPSTSPANARMKLDDLVRAYSAILRYIPEEKR